MARRPILRGDVRLRSNMRRMARSYTGREMDVDIEAALEPMRRETVQNARPLRDAPGKYPGFPQPSGTPKGGHLDEGVVSARVDAKARRRTWWVSFQKRARKLAHLVEFGTAPHFQPNFKGGFRHPGATPKPFFRKAYEAKKSEAFDILRVRAWARLLSAARRLKTR